MIIRELGVKDIDQMSVLLANRHKNERTSFHSLNVQFENSAVTKEILSKKFEDNSFIGVGAFDGEVLNGFLLSVVKEDNLFGRCAWVYYDGLAIREDIESSLYKNLYTYISEKWIQLGCFKHYVILPCGDDNVVNTWLSLGFAYEQVYGIQSLKEQECPIREDIVIKTASEENKKDLESISSLILSYQAGAPTYAAALPQMFSEIKKGYGGLVDDENAHVLLAYENKDLLAFSCAYYEEDEENMMMPQKVMELAVAGTNHEKQSKGIGSLLTYRLFNDAIDAGCQHTVTDWRMTNLKSSVFWPKMGYKAYAYRMIRRIDERVLWANGLNRL